MYKPNPVATKYVVNSLAATTADFLTFYMLVNGILCEAVTATMLGNIAGAFVSFWILQRWVFVDAAPEKLAWQLSKFAAGVGICIVSNMLLVAVLNHFLGWAPWPSRVTAAIGAWGLGYWINHKLVFRKADNVDNG